MRGRGGAISLEPGPSRAAAPDRPRWLPFPGRTPGWQELSRSTHEFDIHLIIDFPIRGPANAKALERSCPR